MHTEEPLVEPEPEPEPAVESAPEPAAEPAAEPEPGPEPTAEPVAAPESTPQPAPLMGDTVILPVTEIPQPLTPTAQPTAPAAPFEQQLLPTVSAGAHVVVIVSRGPSAAPPAMPVGMPDVLGEQQGDALLDLQDVGLSVEVLHDHHARMPRGYVIGQFPSPGGGVRYGADAVILVSSGRVKLPAPAVVLPRVVGLSHTMAADRLISAGLVPRIVYDYDPIAAPGLVLAQIPSPESLAVRLRRRGGSLWIFAVLALVAVAIAAGAVWYFNRPMSIPNVIGLTQAQAQQSVTLAGFGVGSVATTQTSDPAEIGNVIEQWPAPGATAAHGSTVNLVVSGGLLLVPVPNVTNQTRSSAESALTSMGLVPSISQTYSSTAASGTVILQAPAPGQQVPRGTKVGITVSMGQQTVQVPSVIGVPLGTAETTLKGAGLEVASATAFDASVATDQVIAQWPSAGTNSVPGVTVGLLVSRGLATTSTPTVTVPNVVGLLTSKAKSKLSAVPLGMFTIERAGTGRPTGEIVAQMPSANTTLLKESTVVVFASNGK